IYRDVWLVDRSPVSIVTDGVHADPRRQADGRWRIPVEATLYSIETEPAIVAVIAELLDPSGSVIAAARGEARAIPLQRTTARLEIGDIRPLLWSVENPHLYSVRTRIHRGG